MFKGRKLAMALAFAVVAGVAVQAAPAMADTEAHAEKHVYVLVDPNISIGGSGDNGGDPNDSGWEEPNGEIEQIFIGRIQTGMICGWLRWRIDANTEAVRLCLAASDLYKGDDPVNPTVPPIPLYVDGGVEFDAEFGNPALGQSATQPFTSQTTLGDWQAMQSEYVTIESSQNGHFSQYVTTHLCWYQDDPEKPQGQYSGVVALWGFVVPSLSPSL